MARETYAVCDFWRPLYTGASYGYCRANEYHPVDEITCYNDGDCDGSGTCAVCSYYSVSGLLYYTSDGEGHYVNFPMVYSVRNIRAILGQCLILKGGV